MHNLNMILLALVACFLSFIGSSSRASDERPALMAEDEEIAFAESAGPPGIAKSATVYVLKRGGFEVARKGSNGFACIVTRDDPGSFEPQCFDPEGTEALLPVAIERARLLEAGASRDEVEAAIGKAYADGQFRVPRRSGVTYMLSKANRVYNGKDIINYPPHIMIMAPYVTNDDIGADHSDPNLPWVLNEGRPSAYIMVVTANQQTTH